MPAVHWRLLHVLALCTLAITQPLLGILGDNPTFFTAHDSSPGQIVWLALIVAVLPSALLGATEVAAHLIDQRVAEWLHVAIVSVLGFLVVIQIVDVLPGPWLVPVVIAIAITAGMVALYVSKDAIRAVVSVLSLSPVVFVALFLFVSPASSVVFPDDVEAVDLGDILTDDAFGPGPATGDPVAERRSIAQEVNARFPPIFFLVFDELPVASLLDETGEIDGARWPNFARLADTSHLFSNATTVGYTTELAVPPMLTGRYETAAAPVYSLYPENLFTLLGDIYDVSSSDPLVDLCPPSICNGAPPQSILDLLAVDLAVDTAGTAETASVSDEVSTPPPVTDDRSSFGLLFDDAMVVFGHLVTPDGLDIGLPSIGATWGNFGGDAGADPGRDDQAAPDPTAGAPSTSTTTTTLRLDVGQVPVDEVVEVDADAVNEENVEFLDSLITDDSRVADFRAEVAAMSASETPRLRFLHTLLPHVPWRLHPSGDTYVDAELAGYFFGWDNDPTAARASQQRHLLQLGFADRLLGEFLDQLEREGILDDATVIVAADHGIAFVPGSPARAVNALSVGGVAAVPLFYKLPGQTEPGRHLDPVVTIDIVATIAAQLDVEIPWEVDGHDLFGPPVARDRAVLRPFEFPIPDSFLPLVEAATDDLLATFGNGTTGNLYGLGGMHDLIGASVVELVDEPTAYCWVRDRSPRILDEPDATGFVFGRLETSRAERIRLALTAGDTLTGTSVTIERSTAHRVFALGDPQFWTASTVGDIGLHEIVDDRLRPIPEC